MKVIITNNTSVAGKSLAADPRKVIDLKTDDAQALINAGKAKRAPAEVLDEKPKKAAGK